MFRGEFRCIIFFIQVIFISTTTVVSLPCFCVIMYMSRISYIFGRLWPQTTW